MSYTPEQVRFYDWYANFDYDIEFYQEILQGCQGKILELAAGTGRLCVPLAKSGLQMIALDLCAPMLEKIRQKDPTKSISVVCSDMTNFRIAEPIQAAFIAFNSFLLLPSLTKQKLCLSAIASHMSTNGLLIIDAFHPGVFLTGPGFDGKMTLLGGYPCDGGTLHHWFAGQHDCVSQIVIGHNILEYYQGGTAQKYPYTEILRYVHRFEMELLLESCGFSVEQVFGWFDKRPLDSSSRKMIFVARKK